MGSGESTGKTKDDEAGGRQSVSMRLGYPLGRTGGQTETTMTLGCREP